MIVQDGIRQREAYWQTVNEKGLEARVLWFERPGYVRGVQPWGNPAGRVGCDDGWRRTFDEVPVGLQTKPQRQV